MSESVEETPGQPAASSGPSPSLPAEEAAGQPTPAAAADTPGQSVDTPAAAVGPANPEAPASPELPAPPEAPAAETAASSGPLSLERIRQLRMSQQANQQAARKSAPRPPRDKQRPAAASSGAGHPGVGSSAPQGPASSGSAPPPAAAPASPGTSGADQATPAAPASPSSSGEPLAAPASQASQAGQAGQAAAPQFTPAHRGQGRSQRGPRGQAIPTPEPVSFRAKVAVPSTRQPLPQDLEQELNAALGLSDLDKLLVGDEMLQVGRELTEGQRLQATVMKVHGEHVFVSLGGPNEGMIPALSFETLPQPGDRFDVVVRGFLAQEGLYELTVPGNAVDVSDWSDLNEGEVIEALATAANTGGLECKVGNIQGFIPASQVAEYRVENLADFVGQKLLCVVTEANPRRGNLVLSHRAVLEREKKEKREQRLASIEVGMSVEGIVRKILDFGAFVDIGGLDGLLHVSQLSWERVKHPSEVLEEGQKIQVRIEKIDEATGKIGLSFRSLQEHPWTDIETRFPVGALVRGNVTRIAEFGAFVRIATGVEGLVHVSELAHYRVASVAQVVQEGQEVEVKVLSVDGDQQRISLSLKAAQASPAPAAESSAEEAVHEEAPPPKPVLPKHRGPLKGGTGNQSSGNQFGLKW